VRNLLSVTVHGLDCLQAKESDRKRMFLSVFKLYSKELGVENLDEAKFKEVRAFTLRNYLVK